jgi:uncharacterized UPF0160 family protein
MAKPNLSEGIAYKYFRNKGYSLLLGKFESDKTGIPDFLVEKNNERFWLEVKSESFGSSLSVEQIKTISELPEKTFLAIVNPEKEIELYEMNFKKVIM